MTAFIFSSTVPAMKLAAARLFVRDVVEARKFYADRLEFSGAPEKQDWGGWLATFKNPAGNELQLVQLPA